MGKYGNGLTMTSVCELEVKECEKILSTYNVSAEDIEEITSMIKEGWYQAHQAACSGRVLERMLHETGAKLNLQHYMELSAEEENRYPWDIR